MMEIKDFVTWSRRLDPIQTANPDANSPSLGAQTQYLCHDISKRLKSTLHFTIEEAGGFPPKEIRDKLEPVSLGILLLALSTRNLFVGVDMIHVGSHGASFHATHFRLAFSG